MKQEYKKPQVVKVNLKVEQTVLAGCKMATAVGPGDPVCAPFGVACSDTTQPS